MAQLTLRYRIFFLVSRIPGMQPRLLWLRRKGVLHVRRALAAIFRAAAPDSWNRVGAPKSVVCLYDRLLAGDPSLEGRIIHHKQELTQFGPASMTVRCGQRTDIYQPFPIIWTHHRNVRLVSFTLALVLPPKRLVQESTYGPRSLWAEPGNQYVWLPKAKALQGNYTSLVSSWVPNHSVANFSHWLLDALPRLALIEEFPRDTVVLVPGRIAKYQIESLEMLGLGNRYRPTPERHLKVESYYLSSPPSMVVCESAYSLKFLRDRFLPLASKGFQGPRRFIIDRPGMTRGIQNNDEFKRFFQDLGWSIIDTATLSFADEIKLFMEAEAICGAIGSGFTNAVWCSPGCAVIQLASASIMDGSTEWICAHNHLRWRFLICPMDASQNMFADLREVKNILMELDLV